MAAAEHETDDLIDDDILEIFVEEATEVLETINEQFPAWQADPGNAEVRLEVRRAFHTLKGSGRMVKATFISELAWAVENMMNRITDGTIALSPPVFTLIDEVREVMPSLIEAFQARQGAPLDVDPMIRRADALARGEPEPAPAAPVAASMAVPVTMATAAVAEPAAEPALSEEDMQQINERLDTLARQVDSLTKAMGQLQGGLSGLQQNLAAVQKVPTVSPDTVKAMTQGLELAQNEIQALKLAVRNNAERLEGDARQVKSAVAQLQQQDSGVDELRTAVTAEIQALHAAQHKAGQTARTTAAVALVAALLGIGLSLFFHWVA